VSGWDSFLEVQAGTSASLLGLRFVSLSINISRIVASRSLPNRALESLVILFLNLLVASLFLVPSQSVTTLGAEIMCLVIATWVGVTMLQVSTYRKKDSSMPRRALASTVLGQLVSISWVLAGAMLFAEDTGALFWFIPAFLMSYFLGLLNAWVLLVEINR
jgi:hypothetical protein